jgi:type VI secretion system secreted protein Hcp
MAETFLDLGNIKGESLDSVHGGQIEVSEWNWSLENKAPYDINSTKAASHVEAQDIKVTKVCDKATTLLTKYCALGTYIPSATLTCRKNAPDKKVEYLKITLNHVKISGVNWEAGPDLVVKEVVTLSFGQFKMEYTGQLNTGDAGTPEPPFGYSIKTHQEVS